MVRAVVGLALACAVSAGGVFAAQSGSAGEESGGGEVVVGMLRYGEEGMSSICFAPNFLSTLRFETGIDVRGSFAEVALGSKALFEHPFVVMTGEGGFELTEAEVVNLRGYLERGGFLLASAGCSNQRWASSMRRALDRTLPGAALVELGMDHPVFSTVFSVSSLETTKPGEVGVLYGIELEGRLVVVFSPQGLNDTQNAVEECCCCGASEIRDAKLVNVNALAYALTR